jgi:hypothetical protein
MLKNTFGWVGFCAANKGFLFGSVFEGDWIGLFHRVVYTKNYSILTQVCAKHGMHLDVTFPMPQ